MKRVGLIAGALALAAMASAPAKADFSILVWKTSKMCQIWDNLPGYGPAPAVDYVIAAKAPTWDAAVNTLNSMVGSRRCW